MMSDVDEYGFVKNESENMFKSDYLATLTKRAVRWQKIFPSSRIEQGRCLKRFVSKGETLLI